MAASKGPKAEVQSLRENARKWPFFRCLKMSRPVFTDDFLDVLGSWQQGWRENQDVRIDYAANLERIAGLLPIANCFEEKTTVKSSLMEIFRKSSMARIVGYPYRDRTHRERSPDRPLRLPQVRFSRGRQGVAHPQNRRQIAFSHLDGRH